MYYNNDKMKTKVATVMDAPLRAGTRVLMRVDFNLPLDAQGQITDDKRLVDSLPTIQYCLQQRAKVIICSHLGRPDGAPDPRYSLRPVYQCLCAHLPGVDVQFAPDCVGDAMREQVAKLAPGAVLLLENTRFHAGETANDPDFARQLASCGEIFVNDAFGTAHRAHASTVGVTQYLPGYAGLLMAREIQALSQIIHSPERPFTVIVGGKKAADKLPLAERLAARADYLLVGGKVAADWSADPADCRAEIHVAHPVDRDITPETIAEWQPIIARSRTIFWNGPLGQFEEPQYAVGTRVIAQAVVDSGAVSVVGGGDTAAAVKGFGFTHISTGGSAALEFVQGAELPGIHCLQTKGVN